MKWRAQEVDDFHRSERECGIYLENTIIKQTHNEKKRKKTSEKLITWDIRAGSRGESFRCAIDDDNKNRDLKCWIEVEQARQRKLRWCENTSESFSHKQKQKFQWCVECEESEPGRKTRENLDCARRAGCCVEIAMCGMWIAEWVGKWKLRHSSDWDYVKCGLHMVVCLSLSTSAAPKEREKLYFPARLSSWSGRG